MATKLKFNKKVGKKILALLLSVLTVFTCITPVMSVLAVNTTTVDDAIYIKERWYGHTRLGIRGHITDKDNKDIQVTSDGKNHSAFCIQYVTSDSGSTCTNDGGYGWLVKQYWLFDKRDKQVFTIQAIMAILCLKFRISYLDDILKRVIGY